MTERVATVDRLGDDELRLERVPLAERHAEPVLDGEMDIREEAEMLRDRKAEGEGDEESDGD